jgi:uncharacterized protein (TIGR03435 family)
VRSLLAERFRLGAHSAQKQDRYLALTVADASGRPGPKLLKCEGSNRPSLAGGLVPRGARFSVSICAPMSDLALTASKQMGTRVVDKTGLTGSWSHFMFFADQALTTGPSDQIVDPSLQPFSDALRDQLGLKLDTVSGPVDVLVVDSIEQPSEN